MDNQTKNELNSIGQANQNQLENKSFSRTSFMSQKTDKISTAIYMVTESLETSEPLKTSLRELALKTMSLMKGLQSSKETDSFELCSRSISKFEEVVSLLSLAGSVGILSEMNTGILIAEITKVLDELKAKESYNLSTSKTQLLSEDFFTVKEDSIKEESLSFKMSFREKPEALTSVMSFKNSTNLFKDPKIKENNLKDNRKDKIILIVKDKGSVTIKDIMSQIKDCSEKTIQRELGFLVESSVLKRVGERRWSQYSLK